MNDATRIVIADDHPMMRRALAEAMGEILGAPVEIAEAASLAEVRALLGAGAADLVLLDLSMPGTSGFGGLAELRRAFPAVPVLVVSANEDPQVMRQAMAFGAA